MTLYIVQRRAGKCGCVPGSQGRVLEPREMKTSGRSCRRGVISVQYWLALKRSMPAMLPRARQVWPSVESLMKCTLPSPNSAFTPPGW